MPLCEWCAQTQYRGGAGRPVAAPLVFPSPGKPAQASFPLISEQFDRLATSIAVRRGGCRWDPRAGGGWCGAPSDWRVLFDFVTGHLCEAHRDRVARREGPGGVEPWLRKIGILVSTRFPPVRRSECCEFVPRLNRGRGCNHAACCVEIVSTTFDVCVIHFNVFSSALAYVRKRPPARPQAGGWWWD